MIESEADRLASIQALGGQLVSFDGGKFWAIFENEYSGALRDGLIDSSQPALTCRTSDVPKLQRNSSVTVGDITFKVVRQEPDGTGMSVIFLAR